MRPTGPRSSVAACAELALILAAACLSAHGAAQCQPEPAAQEERAARVTELEQAGQTEMGQERFAEAVTHFRELACLVPKNAVAFYNLGAAEAASGDLAGALKSLRESTYLDPLNPLPVVMLVRVTFTSGDLDHLKASLRDAATRFPRNAELHQLLSRFLTEKNLWDLALAEALRARQAADGDSGATLGVAVLENAVGAYTDAALNATALERQSSLPDRMRASAAGVAGLSYEGLGQRDDAITHLRQAIRLDPLRETSYLALAMLLEKHQDYAEAAAVLQQGRQSLPDSMAFLLPLGSNLVRAEKYTEGIDVLRKVLRQSPDAAEAYLQLAEAFRKTGAPGQEAQILRELRLRSPDYPMIDVMIARAMLDLDTPEYTKVLEELARAEKKSPTDADVFYLRGKVYTQMGREEDAIAAFRRAIDLRPTDPGPYYQLGRLYQKRGRAGLAKEQFDRLKFLEENNKNGGQAQGAK